MNFLTSDVVKKVKIAKSTLYKWLTYYEDFITVNYNGRIKLINEETIAVLLHIKESRDKGLTKEEIKKNLVDLGYKKKSNNSNVIKIKKSKKYPTTPLRFPGAKSKALKRMEPYFKVPHREYREPFVGGGSIFFGKDKVESNWINDKDENVYSLYLAIRDHAEELCNMVESTFPSLKLWLEKRQKVQYDSVVERGFDFLFFNRTNFSGIYAANPLGGMKQESEYPIYCRWNPVSLCKRIRECSIKLQGVKITNYNFEELLTTPGEDVLLILDPPYYHQGKNLYPVSMSSEEHQILANLLQETNHKYLLTIDDCPETRAIYMNKHTFENQETWDYSINPNKTNRTGNELFISNFYIG